MADIENEISSETFIPSENYPPKGKIITKPNQRATVLIEDIFNLNDVANKLLKPDVVSSAFSFNEISKRLAPENLNLQDKEIILEPNSINNFSIDVSCDENYVGLNKVTVSINPLESAVIAELTPEHFKSGPLVVKKSNNNYSALDSVTIGKVNISDLVDYTISQSDIESTNSFTIPLDTEESFGTKELNLTVPLLSNKVFTVNANTLGNTYTPASPPIDLDGEISEADRTAIGFKSITLNAALSTLSSSTIINTAHSGGGTVRPSDLNIGYSAVTIPQTESIVIKSTLGSRATEIVSTGLGWNKIKLFPFSTSSKTVKRSISVNSNSLTTNIAIPYPTENDTESDHWPSLSYVGNLSVKIDVSMATNISVVESATIASLNHTFSGTDFGKTFSIKSNDNNKSFLQEVTVTLPSLTFEDYTKEKILLLNPISTTIGFTGEWEKYLGNVLNIGTVNEDIFSVEVNSSTTSLYIKQYSSLENTDPSLTIQPYAIGTIVMTAVSSGSSKILKISGPSDFSLVNPPDNLVLESDNQSDNLKIYSITLTGGHYYIIDNKVDNRE